MSAAVASALKLDLGVAGGLATGGAVDYVIGFTDGGLLAGLGADMGKK